MTCVLAIDQGTTSSRAILFDADMRPIKSVKKEFNQYFPRSGWVEHDVEEIWQSVVCVCREAISQANIEASDIAAIGITNQRETTVVWERNTGKAVYNAIVWQDRRTSDFCQTLKAGCHEESVSATTGLLLDPYFSGTKLAWILDHVEGARTGANAGELLFGTIDSYLIWRLTDGRVHMSDATNAARTMLYDIHKGEWSRELCDLLDIPPAMLPRVGNCADDFGSTTVFGGKIPICGVAGDQQAATLGQACFEPGMLKSTYGTGCFALLNTGDQPVRSHNRLLTTIACQLAGKPTYALEGSVYIAGAVVQWLRDGLKLIDHVSQSGELVRKADERQHVIMVPAFTGLGAPYWNSECRGAIFGLTRNSGPAELVRAALQSVGFQTRDLYEAMRADWPGTSENTLRVDGGMSASDYTMQFLADILNAPVERPEVLETTALGVAWLAGMRAGVYPDKNTVARSWSVEARFVPQMDAGKSEELYRSWNSAVAATLSAGA